MPGTRIRNGALAGRREHALRHRDAGVDVIVSSAYEAAASPATSPEWSYTPRSLKQSRRCLCLPREPWLPAVRSQPLSRSVLRAAGSALPRLTSQERRTPAVQPRCSADYFDDPARYLAASSSDTVRTRHATGKLASAIAHAVVGTPVEADNSPGYLPMPLQGLLLEEAQARIGHARRSDIGFMPAGQVIGMLNEIKLEESDHRRDGPRVRRRS